MKKFAFLQVLFLWALFIPKAQSQEYFLNPTSMVNSNADTDIPLFVCPTLDVDAMLAEDKANDAIALGPRAFAKGLDVGLTTSTDGAWITIDSVQVWRQKIFSDGAYGLMVKLENIKIPEKSSIFIYNDDMTHIVGPLQYNLNQYGTYLSELIPGSSVTIELVTKDKVETSTPYLTISQVAHDYMNLSLPYFLSNPIMPCVDIDVNCPQYDAWLDQKRSVGLLILINSQGKFVTMSGALINNTLNNGKPLFLTAFHGFESSRLNEMAAVAGVYLNWESASCNSNTANPQRYYMVGATVKSYNPNIDYVLLEFNDRLPSSYYPYFSGWNKSGANPAQGTGIHHPRGNLKKIAHSSNSFTTNPYNVFVPQPNNMPMRKIDAGTAWEVTFDEGGVEPGSSGSPLFDENKKIVGLLSEGALYVCGKENHYSTLKAAWIKTTNNGATMQEVLDPLLSGKTEILGYIPAGWRNDWLIGWNQPGEYKMHPNIKSLATGTEAIYYRGTDNKMQKYFFGNNGWLHDWVRGVNVPNSELIGGDVVVGEADQLFYVGTDNHVHTYYKMQNGWGHGLLTLSPNNNLHEKASIEPGSLAVGYGNQIFYRGTDNKMHTYYWTQTGWQHNWIVSNAPSNENVAGDVVVGKQGGVNQVFYRGSGGKMHTYWYNSATSKWVHAVVLSSAPEVSSKPGSIAVGPDNQLYYRATNDHMYQLYYASGGWHYQSMSTNLQNNQRVSGDITCAPGQVYYRGEDGKMHIFWFDDQSHKFVHDWIETSWQAPNRNNITGAIEVSHDGQIYYRGSDGLVRVYFWGGQLMQRPGTGNPTELEKDLIKTPYLADDFSINAYPNPTKDKLSLLLESKISDTYIISVTDLSGRQVFNAEKTLNEGFNEVNLPIFTTLSSGTYIVIVKGKKNTTNKEIKIIKRN